MLNNGKGKKMEGSMEWSGSGWDDEGAMSAANLTMYEGTQGNA